MRGITLITLAMDVWYALPVFFPSCHRRSKSYIYSWGLKF
jgi:hypothetical protein